MFMSSAKDVELYKILNLFTILSLGKHRQGLHSRKDMNFATNVQRKLKNQWILHKFVIFQIV